MILIMFRGAVIFPAAFVSALRLVNLSTLLGLYFCSHHFSFNYCMYSVQEKTKFYSGYDIVFF